MNPFPFQQLDIYLAARELAVLVQRAELRDAELRDHATRAAKSVFLNVAEGLPERGLGASKRHFAIARNSLGELVAALDLACALGAVDGAKAEQALALAGRVRPMLYGLMRPGR